MIQRIQSIWLLLAAVACFLTLRFSFYSGTNENGATGQFLTGASYFLLLLTTITIGILALIIIFLFKTRIIQIRLCIAGMILELLLIFLYFREVQKFILGTYSLTAILHLVILLSFLLAARGVHKDEKLIRESDRLR